MVGWVSVGKMIGMYEIGMKFVWVGVDVFEYWMFFWCNVDGVLVYMWDFECWI